MKSRFAPVLQEGLGILGILTMTLALLGQAFGTNPQAFVSFGKNGEETASVVSWENLNPHDEALESDSSRPLVLQQSVVADQRN